MSMLRTDRSSSQVQSMAGGNCWDGSYLLPVEGETVSQRVGAAEAFLSVSQSLPAPEMRSLFCVESPVENQSSPGYRC